MKDYNFVLLEECGNHSEHSFDVNDEIDEDDLEMWEESKGEGSGSLMYNNGIVLNKLCVDGHIEAGEYIVNVSW